MLTFIEFGPGDQDFLSGIFQDPEIMRYTLDDPFTDDGLSNYFRRILANNTAGKERTQYEYKVLDGETAVGFADFEIIRKTPVGGIAEIGYLLLREYWGKGYGCRTANELIRICFEDLKLHKVTASCNEENTGSWKIMEKCGMNREGVFAAQRWKNGSFADELKYGILNDKYFEKKINN